MSFKVVGYIVDGNLFIPLDSNIFSINILNNIDNIKSYVYLQDIHKYKCNLSLSKLRIYLQ